MSLSQDQKKGVTLAIVSFTLLLAVSIAYTYYSFHYCLTIILVFFLLLMMFWGMAKAMTSPDSGESVAFNFRRLIAAGKGVGIKSEREIEQEEMDKTAINLDDQERIDRL
jgi:predicted membrane protein